MSDFILTDNIISLLEAPCREIKPVEPFPFKSNRISRGIIFQDHLVLFPFYPEYKKLQHLYTFNLSNRKWGSVELKNSPDLLAKTDNYRVVSDENGGFILFGCYKESQANTTGNLFFQSQAVTLKKTLGWISAKITAGELMLEWKEFQQADQLPYREKFSASLIQGLQNTSRDREKGHLAIFGGYDENGTLMNDLFRFNFEDNQVAKISLHSNRLGGNDYLPSARISHASPSGDSDCYIFGGEDQSSNILNDVWIMNSGMSRLQCFKLNRKPIDRCPKLDTPSLWFEPLRGSNIMLYIARSTTQALPPFKNYLCVEKLNFVLEESVAWSQKKPLPFDSVPHTMVNFEDKLILGFEASIYEISYTTMSPTPDFENAEDENEGTLTRKTRPKNYKGHIRQYFEEKPFPDVTFRVQGQEVFAHKGILSVRCPFFRELFEIEGGSPIEIADLSLAGFNALLEWLYCNEILDFKEEEAVEIVKTANKYSLPKLKIEAETCLIKNLTTETILQRAKLAVEWNARDLETAVVNFIVKERGQTKRKEELESMPVSIRERVMNIEMREKQ